MADETQNLTQLGEKTPLPTNPDLAKLEAFTNRNANPLCVRFTCPEFTSLCPLTGAPDFATIVIDYVPDALMVESKSLKLFLGAFRNHGAFHESCTSQIYDRLSALLSPRWLRVAAFFYPRGGIPIDVIVSGGEIPIGLEVFALDPREFRGR